jgi:hypothetical protein
MSKRTDFLVWIIIILATIIAWFIFYVYTDNRSIAIIEECVKIRGKIDKIYNTLDTERVNTELEIKCN